jgi:hypothetical protein
MIVRVIREIRKEMIRKRKMQSQSRNTRPRFSPERKLLKGSWASTTLLTRLIGRGRSTTGRAVSPRSRFTTRRPSRGQKVKGSR